MGNPGLTTSCAAEPAEQPPLAAIRFGAGTAIDALLCDVADRLAACGIRVAGLVQDTTPDGDSCCGAVHLRDVRDGSRVAISQDLGPGATGCRLDSTVLAEVAADLERSLDGTLQMLVLNRFGKAEAEGGGLRPVIQKAVALGVPVLTAVKDEYAEAWGGFHGGLGTALPPDQAVVVDWCRRAVLARVRMMGER